MLRGGEVIKQFKRTNVIFSVLFYEYRVVHVESDFRSRTEAPVSGVCFTADCRAGPCVRVLEAVAGARSSHCTSQDGTGREAGCSTDHLDPGGPCSEATSLLLHLRAPAPLRVCDHACDARAPCTVVAFLSASYKANAHPLGQCWVREDFCSQSAMQCL